MSSQENQVSSTFDRFDNDSESVSKISDNESIHYDGRHYNLVYEKNYLEPDFLVSDIPFWIDMASRYGDPILELCCGNGRIAIPLVEKGWQVTGIDISQSMLEDARRKCSSVKWIQADVQNFNLDQQFSLIIFPLNSLGHLADFPSVENCLSMVRKHLQPEGRFIIDLENYLSEDYLEFLLSKTRNLYSIYEDPDGKGTVIVTNENEVDWPQQIWTWKLFFKLAGGKKEILEETKIKLYFPKELEMLLKYNGFTIEHCYGDYDFTPFTSQSPRQLLICRCE
ncbi:methyltransferase domain-containing protein [Dolichospermum sp. LEGE 00240]|uniref:class I SAM-dependent DNA methyltransferase n=1 Tax=Dolichospermum sp. LEGE 00240 TaxID=1828603 RepID=UPI00187DF62E|nr:class I SAM-dependent methyltransferase [Dolichospermum sp. LEGE 00240]MBE9247905.1 methyltransferase domain-containing protein [Dolichospermum sp. LEGE 00240]MDM3850120.1 class I SAM-dependent methyltransferase [Aphanizomenon gracile PMC627.10]